MVAEMKLFHPLCKVFLDGLATVMRSRAFSSAKDRVLRVERGQGSGIVVVPRVTIFLQERDNLLTQLWIGRVCLLGKSRQSKADCQPYKGK